MEFMGFNRNVEYKRDLQKRRMFLNTSASPKKTQQTFAHGAVHGASEKRKKFDFPSDFTQKQ